MCIVCDNMSKMDNDICTGLRLFIEGVDIARASNEDTEHNSVLGKSIVSILIGIMGSVILGDLDDLSRLGKEADNHSLEQRQRLMALREQMTEAAASENPSGAHDINELFGVTNVPD